MKKGLAARRHSRKTQSVRAASRCFFERRYLQGGLREIGPGDFSRFINCSLV
jgi:hypothetical protein